MSPLKSLSRSTKRKSRSRTRYTDTQWDTLPPTKRLSVIDQYLHQEENFPQSSYFSLRENNLNTHPNIPSRKKSKKKKVCKSKSSIRGKIKTSKKYPSHLFQRNGKVWLKSSKNNKNNKNPIYCTCNVFLKKNPRYSQCKYHPPTEPYPHEYNHKILYEVFHDKKIPKGMQVDHINNNSKDNRLRNLRLLTKNQNMQNRRSKKNGRSKYKGVTFNKESKKKPWKARINYNNVQKYLGTFETELEAYQAYKREARKLNKTMNTKFME